MSDQDHRLKQHYEVLMKLAKRKSWDGEDLDSTLREVTEAASRLMDIERVNIWLYDERRTKIECIEHYERSSDLHRSGGELRATDYPRYFRALDEERTIVANDAPADPRTSELADGYLDVNGITSMLDAPLHSGGNVIGIICHEHVGERIWQNEERQFAASLADLASLALESVERKRAEHELMESEQRTRDIILHALDAIVIVDEAERITDWNPRSEVIFGWLHEEVIGKTLCETVIPDRYHADHQAGMQRFLKTGEGAILNKRIEINARDKSGREFPVELAVTAIRSDEKTLFSAFVRDISVRVQAQLEIHKLNAQLEERVQERTTQLEAAVFEKERLLDDLQANSLELVARVRELELKSATIRSDLERAQIIQRALLPAEPPLLAGVHVEALYRPGMYVGGDMYDVALVDEGRIAFYVADAAGHGVAAAMLSVLFKQRLRMCDDADRAHHPATVLSQVNDYLAGDVHSRGLFLTAAYVLIDTQRQQLFAASAGHTPMLLQRASGENTLLTRTGPALGLVADATFEEHSLPFRTGDRLMLYSDGLIDGLTVSEDEALIPFLLQFMSGEVEDGPHRLRRRFLQVDQSIDTEQGGHDDVTLLLFEATAGVSSFDNDPGDDEVRKSDSPTAPVQSWVLWVAENADETRLEVRGRGTWLDCEMFHQLALTALDEGKRLDIDLSECTLLDSAFLGTLHEVVNGHMGKVVVRNPGDTVYRLFEELVLDRVLASVHREDSQPIGNAMPVQQQYSAEESQQRLLRAHEILSGLSEENRDRFAGVIKSLRSELHGD